MMKAVHISLLLVIGMLVTACGPSQMEQDAQATAAAVSQTAEAYAAHLRGIQEALAPVAAGQGVPQAAAYDPDAAGPPRLVILGQAGFPHAWNAYLPLAWRPAAVNETALVVLLGDERVVSLGTQEYWSATTGTSYVSRDRYELDVQVREARSGQILVAETIMGSEPPPFPEEVYTSTESLAGGHVRYGDLEEWLYCDQSLPGADGWLCAVRRLEGHTESVISVVFSPDGQILATGSTDQTIRLWQMPEGILLRTLEGHSGEVESVAFSPDGQTLASGSFDRSARLWRVSDGALLRTLSGHTGQIRQVAFSPDGLTLASASSDQTTRLWRVSDGTLLSTLEGHTGSAESVAFSPDGQTLASGSSDMTIRLWQMPDGALLRTLEGHTDWVKSVAFSPDGQTLASGSWDDTVRLWRAADGFPLRTLTGHSEDVWGVAFSPDGQVVASASSDQAVRLWRVSDGALLRTLVGHTDVDWESPFYLAFSPDGLTLASGWSDDVVRLWR